MVSVIIFSIFVFTKMKTFLVTTNLCIHFIFEKYSEHRKTSHVLRVHDL